MAPLTRYRANDAHAHTDLAVEYYSQRASTPGTMIITEATYISQKASGQANAPGLYSKEQIAAWKKVRFLSTLTEKRVAHPPIRSPTLSTRKALSSTRNFGPSAAQPTRKSSKPKIPRFPTSHPPLKVLPAAPPHPAP